MTLAFIVGSGRSGTTWLQMLLAQHPLIASAPETNLFSGYLARLDQRYRKEKEDRRASYRTGISDLLSEDDFVLWMNTIARELYEAIRATKPGARIVLDKTPHHVHQAELIHRLFPEARFIHMIRDPRAVAASMIKASGAWGSQWAPASPTGAVRFWVDAVEAGLKIRGMTSRLLEIYYEDVVRDGSRELARTFDFLGLEVAEEICSAYVEACDFQKLKAGAAQSEIMKLSPSTENNAFFHRGASDGWKSELTKSQVQIIEYLARETMQKTNFDRTTSAARKPVRVLVREVLEALEWRLHRWIERL